MELQLRKQIVYKVPGLYDTPWIHLSIYPLHMTYLHFVHGFIL